MRPQTAGWVLAALPLSFLASGGSEPSGNVPADNPKPMVQALQKGGYVLYMRHPATHPDQADTDTMNLDNLKAQRHLNDEGRAHGRSLEEVRGQAHEDVA